MVASPLRAGQRRGSGEVAGKRGSSECSSRMSMSVCGAVFAELVRRGFATNLFSVPWASGSFFLRIEFEVLI